MPLRTTPVILHALSYLFNIGRLKKKKVVPCILSRAVLYIVSTLFALGANKVVSRDAISRGDVAAIRFARWVISGPLADLENILTYFPVPEVRVLTYTMGSDQFWSKYSSYVEMILP